MHLRIFREIIDQYNQLKRGWRSMIGTRDPIIDQLWHIYFSELQIHVATTSPQTDSTKTVSAQLEKMLAKNAFGAENCSGVDAHLNRFIHTSVSGSGVDKILALINDLTPFQ